jgi:hypothetical protein
MDENAFRSEVSEAIVFYELAIRRPATRTRQMIEEHGEVEALSRLMVTADLQQGFKVLRNRNQLDQTFEAVVVRFRDLFADQVVQAAQWRLDHPHDLL